MESDVTQSALYYKFLGWFESHKKQVLWGAIALLVLGLVVSFVVWQRDQKQVTANEALSKVVSRGPGATAPVAGPEALVKVAAEHADTAAGSRALLLAGGKFFGAGKFTEAKAQFDKYIREYPAGQFTAQALFGAAACLEASGKTDEAIIAYKQVQERHPMENVVPQSQLALARLYEVKGNMQMAYDVYLQLERSGFPTVSLQAVEGRERLLAKNPQLAPPAAVPPPIQPAPAQPALTNLAPPINVPAPTNIPVLTNTPVLKFN